MGIWRIGLAAKPQALRAERWGAVACFLAAVRALLGIVLSGKLADRPLDSAIAWGIGASIFPLLLIVTGFALRSGRGAHIGIVTAIALTVDILLKAFGANWVQVTIQTVLFLFVLNGVRGAWTLRPGRRDVAEPG